MEEKESGVGHGVGARMMKLVLTSCGRRLMERANGEEKKNAEGEAEDDHDDCGEKDEKQDMEEDQEKEEETGEEAGGAKDLAIRCNEADLLVACEQNRLMGAFLYKLHRSRAVGVSICHCNVDKERGRSAVGIQLVQVRRGARSLQEGHPDGVAIIVVYRCEEKVGEEGQRSGRGGVGVEEEVGIGRGGRRGGVGGSGGDKKRAGLREEGKRPRRAQEVACEGHPLASGLPGEASGCLVSCPQHAGRLMQLPMTSMLGTSGRDLHAWHSEEGFDRTTCTWRHNPWLPPEDVDRHAVGEAVAAGGTFPCLKAQDQLPACVRLDGIFGLRPVPKHRDGEASSVVAGDMLDKQVAVRAVG
eukprot:757531-Hanusia_phi.AAC.2